MKTEVLLINLVVRGIVPPSSVKMDLASAVESEVDEPLSDSLAGRWHFRNS